jgi:hypothetical protein
VKTKNVFLEVDAIHDMGVIQSYAVMYCSPEEAERAIERWKIPKRAWV